MRNGRTGGRADGLTRVQMHDYTGMLLESSAGLGDSWRGGTGSRRERERQRETTLNRVLHSLADIYTAN